MPSMPDRIPESLQKKISERLSFYDDLGIQLFYKDRAASSIVSRRLPGESSAPGNCSPEVRQQISSKDSFLPKRAPESTRLASSTPPAGLATSSNVAPATRSAFQQTMPPAPSRKLDLPSAPGGPSLFETVNRIQNDTLLKIRDDIGD